MIRPLFTCQYVFGAAKLPRLKLLLQFRFEVRQLSLGLPDIFHLRLEESQHDATGLLDTAI